MRAEDNEEERFLIAQLEAIKREYEMAAKPIVDRLIRLRQLRPTPMFFVSEDKARAAGISIKDWPAT